jgi:hypothetical protein
MHMLIVEMDCKSSALKEVKFLLKRWHIELENYRGQWRALVPTHSYNLMDPVGFVFNIINPYCKSCYVDFWPTVHRRQPAPVRQPVIQTQYQADDQRRADSLAEFDAFLRAMDEEESDFEKLVRESG